MPEISYILYASSETFRFSDADLHALLTSSRQYNSQHAISGMLLYAGGNFIQYIEGPEEEVQGLFVRIARDPRHRSLLPLTHGVSEGRLFPDWSMGFRPLAADDQPLIGEFGLSASALSARLKEERAQLVVVMTRQFYRAAYPYDEA